MEPKIFKFAFTNAESADYNLFSREESRKAAMIHAIERSEMTADCVKINVYEIVEGTEFLDFQYVGGYYPEHKWITKETEKV